MNANISRIPVLLALLFLLTIPAGAQSANADTQDELVEMTVGSPPMSADDAGTAGPGNWEINTSVAGELSDGEDRYEVPRLDFNYGVGQSLQLKFELPFDVVRYSSSTSRALGNASLGLKYRFYDNEKSALSLATYPAIEFRTPGSSGNGVTEATSWLLPLLLTKEFKVVSITANASVGRSTDDPNVILSAIFGAGTRLSHSVALLSEFSASDLNSSDDRRLTFRLGCRKKVDDHQIVFAAVGVDLQGGISGRQEYFTIGYQRLIGAK